MEQPNASMLIIGDELLSGRTQDTNMYYLANELTEVGINLSEARFIRDDTATIVANIVELSTRFDYLFTSGGIGPTHDDITTDCVAQAFGKQVTIRSDAFKILKKYYDEKGIELNEARLRMARIPETADLIENSISGAPGYIIENVYVMAGVPKIFKSMLKTLLPTNGLENVPHVKAAPFVYIAHLMTPFSPQDVVVFTNCEAVKLTSYGKEIGTKKATDKSSPVPRVPVVFEKVFSHTDIRNKNKKI